MANHGSYCRDCGKIKLCAGKVQVHWDRCAVCINKRKADVKRPERTYSYRSYTKHRPGTSE